MVANLYGWNIKAAEVVFFRKGRGSSVEALPFLLRYGGLIAIPRKNPISMHQYRGVVDGGVFMHPNQT